MIIFKKQKKARKRNGYYSVNAVMLFFILVVLSLFLYSSPFLSYTVRNIHNHYIREICQACLQPMIDISENLNMPELVQNIRSTFLRISGLNKHSEWDSFYYEKVQPEPVNTAEAHDTIVNIPQVEKTAIKKNTEIKEGTQKIMYSAEHPLRILMFGDSQMQGIAGGMLRLIGDDPRIIIDEISVHSSGFIRSDYYNWKSKLRTVLKSTIPPYDTAIMFLGMNDIQNFYKESVLLERKSTEWESAYRQKMREHIDIVLEFVPNVYWLGMPCVRQSSYNADLRYLDILQSSVANSYSPEKVHRVLLSEIFPGENNPYRETARTELDAMIRIMKSDGIHYTFSGGEFIMRPVFNNIKKTYHIDDNAQLSLPTNSDFQKNETR